MNAQDLLKDLNSVVIHDTFEHESEYYPGLKMTLKPLTVKELDEENVSTSMLNEVIEDREICENLVLRTSLFPDFYDKEFQKGLGVIDAKSALRKFEAKLGTMEYVFFLVDIVSTAISFRNQDYEKDTQSTQTSTTES